MTRTFATRRREPSPIKAPTRGRQVCDGPLGRILALAGASFLVQSAAIAQQTVEQAAPDAGNGLEEIVVTAEKRTENLQVVPVPVGVISAEQLSEQNIVLFRDYLFEVPGVVAHPVEYSISKLAFRGIEGGTFTVDDLPYQGSAGSTNGGSLPDFDPSDLAHIEVLRGPQGTLYGANSMAGLVKYVTVDPSTESFNGRLEVGASGVTNGAEPGYVGRGAVNIPINDTLAIRVSGFLRQDPGYIDNPVYNVRGGNENEVFGGRITALWRPTDALSVKLGIMYQNSALAAGNEVTIAPGLGQLQTNNLPDSGLVNRKVTIYSANINYQWDYFSVTSITGYSQIHQYNTQDYSGPFGSLVDSAFGVTGSQFLDREPANKVSEEVRFSGTVWDSIDWLVGIFYAQESNRVEEDFSAENPTTLQVLGIDYGIRDLRTFETDAAFGDLTYHFNDQLDVQVGARETSERGDIGDETDSGPLVGPEPVSVPDEPYNDKAFTYLVTPRYRITPDLMVYARFASGFEPGGPNGISPYYAPKYSPQTTKNYEIGFKGELLDKMVSIDTSLYYIDIASLQISEITPNGLNYGANGGAAKSEGVEFTATVRPRAGTTISGWIAYDDAVLTENLPLSAAAKGYSGDRLPLAPRLSAHVAMDQDFPVWRDVMGFAGVQVSYVGSTLEDFVETGPRQFFPAFTKTDFHVGVEYDTWKINAYVNNAFDVRGLISGGIGYAPSNNYVYITPRTAGVNVIKTF